MLTVSDIGEIALLPFPYIAFFATVIAAIIFRKYQTSPEELSNRIIDSKGHLDVITRHMADNLVVIKVGDYHILRPKCEGDVVIKVED